jgi:hypothetical protein
MALPNRAGIVQHLRRRGQPLPFDRWSPGARSSGWCGRIKIGVEAQSGDDTDIVSDGAEEFDGGERSVADHDNPAARQPAMDLQQPAPAKLVPAKAGGGGDLAGTIEQRLRRAWLTVVEAFGRGKHGEKRQPHDAAGPRYMDEQLRGQPAQTAGPRLRRDKP